MAGKTKAELLAEVEELKARIAELESEKKPQMSIHELLESALEYLRNNEFYQRGVNSKGIASLVRSAREKLRIATKK
jgi:hypothetical protein